MLSFRKGDTPTFRFDLNVPVGEFGTPVCVIRQDDAMYELEVMVDDEQDAIFCTLDEKSSRHLIGGFSAWVQHVWFDGIGNVVAFPMEEVMVEDVFLDIPEYMNEPVSGGDGEDEQDLEG